MHNVPWAALIVSGCMIVYVVFLGIASYSPSFVPEKSYGIYHAIIGNMPEKYQKMVSNTSNDPWEHCELPKYDVWDEQIIPYVNPDRNPLKDCDRTFKPLTELKNSSWSIVSNNKNLECRARCHWRKTDRSNKIGDWIRTPGPIDCEFVEAACSENKQDVYGYLHSQVIPKPAIKKPTIETSGLMQFDVFVILLDSLSYSQGKRSLPRTLSYFTNHMDGVIFPYVNKIGENSRPNGVPIWFGKSLEKVDKSLFGEKVVPPDWSYKYFCKTFKDNETSLFSEFHDYGYRYQSARSFTETEPSPIPGEKGHSYIRKQPATPRSCKNMPVPLEYCICQFKKTKLPAKTKIAKLIGKALASAVNTQIEEGNFTGSCIKMEWEKTLSLLMYDHKFEGATLYTVTAEMKEPSRAQFKGNVKVVGDEITVLGMVERSNKYGKTAECVRSEYHRPYCYCRDQQIGS
uniref:Sulfatase domain-containing protein n=1 Tax=Caenorhabditis tropicalis TaxID=1561998 RepID=A0A1I7TND1_9PELO